MDKLNPNLLIYAALGLGLFYVLKKSVDALGSVGGVIADGAHVADTAVTGVVGGIGTAFGLPTPSETVDDPAAVRRIIDTQGYFEASKQGTAMAFFKALNMPSTLPKAASEPMRDVSTVGDVSYDAMGNVTGMGYGDDSPTFTPEQLSRIGGDSIFKLPGYGETTQPTFLSSLGSGNW